MRKGRFCTGLKPCVPPAAFLYGSSKETNPNPLSVDSSLPLNVRGRAGDRVYKEETPQVPVTKA